MGRKIVRSLVVLGLMTVSLSRANTIIFQDDLNGSDALVGTTTDIGEGVWENSDGGNDWRADGTVSGQGDDSAWLPFSPQPGNIYELTGQMSCESGPKYIVLGFAAANSSSAFGHSAANFMLTKDGTLSCVMGIGGSKGNLDYTVASDALLNLKVVVNCSDPHPSNWTVTHSVDGIALPGAKDRMQTKSKRNFGDIRYVGFFRDNGTNGAIKNFQLSVRSAPMTPDVSPVPATLEARPQPVMPEAPPAPATLGLITA